MNHILFKLMMTTISLGNSASKFNREALVFSQTTELQLQDFKFEASSTFSSVTKTRKYCVEPISPFTSGRQRTRRTQTNDFLQSATASTIARCSAVWWAGATQDYLKTLQHINTEVASGLFLFGATVYRCIIQICIEKVSGMDLMT